MSKNIKNIVKKNLNSLFEDHGFEDMEVAFGVQHKQDNLSDEEKNQFGDMEELKVDVEKKGVNLGKPSVDPKLQSVQKKASKEAGDYYKEVSDKMKKFQETETSKESQIGESINEIIGGQLSPTQRGRVIDEIINSSNEYSKEQLESLDLKDLVNIYRGVVTKNEEFNPPKRNVEDDEDFMYNGHMGTGMTGIRYDDEGTENHKNFEERVNELNGDDETYEKLDKYGKEYKEYKYGDKYDEVEGDYQETPKVRTTQKENVMKYSDVIEENIFKTKGEIKSKEQVLKVASKVPNRVKIDETVFAITDGDNYYRLMWEGTENEGEAIITHNKSTETMTESIDKMKYLWNFDASDAESVKKNVTESGEDAFKRLFNKMKGIDNLLGD
jgi:hypothetical protein